MPLSVFACRDVVPEMTLSSFVLTLTALSEAYSVTATLVHPVERDVPSRDGVRRRAAREAGREPRAARHVAEVRDVVVRPARDLVAVERVQVRLLAPAAREHFLRGSPDADVHDH